MATSRLRVRFWIESIVASVTGVLAVVTFFWHDWIEAVFGVDPDRGNGSAEWLVVAVLAAVTVALTAGARWEWRRARQAERVTGTA
jgi:undecaprenyl pyrophosphate phosphatase UppP